MIDLSAAIADADVHAHIDAAVTLERLDVPVGDPDHNPFLSNARVVRDAEPADYVAAIIANIDKFDGIEPGAVTEAAVAAVLPQEEDS